MKNIDLLTESYDFELPTSFIAGRPAARRDNSKLLVYKVSSDEVIHTRFKSLPDFLTSENQLVMNESKVFACRLIGEKETGGKAEVFILSLVKEQGAYSALIKTSGKKREGDELFFGKLKMTIIGRDEAGDFLVSPNMSDSDFLGFLEAHAMIPIPPYIRDGISDEKDSEDYQTVYAKKTGSVAAPTAGLHFTQEVFDSLAKKNIDIAKVTLHVGAGTFKPVSSADILEHKMHSEFYEIEPAELVKINQNKKRIAVGTTSLRVLESAYKDGEIKPEFNDKLNSTEIFIYPGKEVKSVSGLLTNFHLPKSTLLMLVSSLIGREKTLSLYEQAKDNNYRFFSYGDAMLILR